MPTLLCLTLITAIHQLLLMDRVAIFFNSQIKEKHLSLKWCGQS
jgi:hypothetical protein